VFIRVHPWLFLLLGVLGARAEEPASRDPWLRPFASDSIWNMPVGSAAVYEPASLPAPHYVGCDLEWHIRLSSNDPVRPILSPWSWEKRWPGEHNLGEMPVPDDLVISDAVPPSTPNACAVFLMPDGHTIRQLEPACRVEAGGPIVGWLHDEDQDLRGPGIKGSHYGSGLSALGGSIRPGELAGDEPLRHALKLNIWGQHLYYRKDATGFRWPADRSDAKAAKTYKGENPKLMMGSLLALPANSTPDLLEVKTEAGLKIFRALQDYGAYVTDDSGWDASDLCVERTVPEEVRAKFGYELYGSSGPFVDEMKRMIQALMIIDNNTQDNVGGGGTPRREPAPPL
jgi:hypothetical protein